MLNVKSKNFHKYQQNTANTVALRSVVFCVACCYNKECSLICKIVAFDKKKLRKLCKTTFLWVLDS